MRLKIEDWITLLGYAILVWMFFCTTDLFRNPTVYSTTIKEIGDPSRTPDLNQPEFSACQLSPSTFMENSSSVVVITTILLVIMFILTISRVTWSIISRAKKRKNVAFKTWEEEMHRLQNLSIEEHSYLTRKLVDVLEEKSELIKEIGFLTNENIVCEQQNKLLIQQREFLTQALDTAKIEFQSLVEESQAAEAKLRQRIRAFENQQVLDYELRRSHTGVIESTSSISKSGNRCQEPSSPELESSTEQLQGIEQEMDDRNDNYVPKNMDINSEEYDIPSSEILEPKITLVTNQRRPIDLEINANTLYTIYEGDNSSNEHLESATRISGNSNDVLETTQNAERNSNLDNSIAAVSDEYDNSNFEILETAIKISENPTDALNTTQSQVKINLEDSTTIIISNEYDNSNYETLEAAIRISGNSDDALNTTQNAEPKTHSSIITNSDGYDNSNYETLEAAIEISENLTDAPNATQRQVQINLEDTMNNNDETDNSNYETFESSITISENSTDAVSSTTFEAEKITLPRNRSEWETESNESSSEPICRYEKFAALKWNSKTLNIHKTLSISIPKSEHVKNTDKLGSSTHSVQEPQRLVSSSKAFKKFMKNLPK